MAAKAGRPAFGKGRRQHVLILASGEKVRHMTVKPWMAALCFCFIGTIAIGYLGATAYLVLRDNLIGASMARQARMQHEYEDRIAALRAQVDRVTSRQLLDQQLVEGKVEKLLKQQMALTSRHGKLDSLLDRAEQSGILQKPVPVPAQKPGMPAEDHAALAPESGSAAIVALLGKARGATPPAPSGKALAYAPMRESSADRADRLFSKVTLSLKTIEQDQMQRIEKLTAGATETASEIETILLRSGIDISKGPDGEESAVGGPYLPPQPPADFDASLESLDTALSRLETVRETAKRLPFSNPAPGRPVTSRFGNRVDPFLGKLALHSGIDFRETTGGEIKSAGAGTVTAAGPSGGYGNMVEIDHGFGIATRYGHMSRILVKEGDKVATGDVIGLAGSTGRSTGPHLHYEVRRDGEAVDPLHFLNAGMKLDALVN